MDDESRVGLVLLCKLGLVISMIGLTFTLIDILLTPRSDDEEDGDE